MPQQRHSVFRTKFKNRATQISFNKTFSHLGVNARVVLRHPLKQDLDCARQ